MLPQCIVPTPDRGVHCMMGTLGLSGGGLPIMHYTYSGMSQHQNHLINTAAPLKYRYSDATPLPGDLSSGKHAVEAEQSNVYICLIQTRTPSSSHLLAAPSAALHYLLLVSCQPRLLFLFVKLVHHVQFHRHYVVAHQLRLASQIRVRLR